MTTRGPHLAAALAILLVATAGGGVGRAGASDGARRTRAQAGAGTAVFDLYTDRAHRPRAHGRLITTTSGQRWLELTAEEPGCGGRALPEAPYTVVVVLSATDPPRAELVAFNHPTVTTLHPGELTLVERDGRARGTLRVRGNARESGAGSFDVPVCPEPLPDE